MNNNKQKQIIILPLYLQKYIIKLICQYINKKIIFNEKELRLNNKFIVKLSLVCWKYHEFISSQLYCCQDFNYIPLEKNFYPPPPLSGRKKYMFENSKYSIYKFENIKTLKLHHREYRYHENDTDIMVKWLNENLLSKLINLKTIYIDIEHKINSNAVFSIDFLNKLKMPITTRKSNNNNSSSGVKIEINNINAVGIDKELVSNVKKIYSLSIDQRQLAFGNISKLLNKPSTKIKSLSIRGNPIIIDEKNFMKLNSESYINHLDDRLDGTTNNNQMYQIEPNSKLTLNFNIEYFNSKYSPLVNDIFKYVTLFRIYHVGLSGILSILTSYPNLKELSISTCFSNLERLLKSNNSTSCLSTTQHNINSCICTKYQQSDIDTWNLIVKNLQNNNNISRFTIIDECLNSKIKDSSSNGSSNSCESNNNNTNLPQPTDGNFLFLNHIFKDCSSKLINLNIHVNSSNINPLLEIINSNRYITNYRFFYKLIDKSTLDKQKLNQLLSSSNHSNNINLTIINTHNEDYSVLFQYPPPFNNNNK